MIFMSKGNSVIYCQNRDTFECEKLLIIMTIANRTVPGKLDVWTFY